MCNLKLATLFSGIGAPEQAAFMVYDSVELEKRLKDVLEESVDDKYYVGSYFRGDDVRVKNLILKFGFRSLVGVCESKGWALPLAKELLDCPEEVEHEVVWVADVPSRYDDYTTHAMVLNMKTKRLELVNKNFMMHAVVLVKPTVCKKCGALV